MNPPNEPSGLWSTQRRLIFDRDISLTQNVILVQGQFALAAMIKRIDALYKMFHHMPQLRGAYVHPDTPDTVTEICAHQGVASNILLNFSKRSRDESARSYKLRIERCGICKIILRQGEFYGTNSFKQKHKK